MRIGILLLAFINSAFSYIDCADTSQPWQYSIDSIEVTEYTGDSWSTLSASSYVLYDVSELPDLSSGIHYEIMTDFDVGCNWALNSIKVSRRNAAINLPLSTVDSTTFTRYFDNIDLTNEPSRRWMMFLEDSTNWTGQISTNRYQFRNQGDDKFFRWYTFALQEKSEIAVANNYNAILQNARPDSAAALNYLEQNWGGQEEPQTYTYNYRILSVKVIYGRGEVPQSSSSSEPSSSSSSSSEISTCGATTLQGNISLRTITAFNYEGTDFSNIALASTETFDTYDDYHSSYPLSYNALDSFQTLCDWSQNTFYSTLYTRSGGSSQNQEESWTRINAPLATYPDQHWLQRLQDTTAFQDSLSINPNRIFLENTRGEGWQLWMGNRYMVDSTFDSEGNLTSIGTMADTTQQQYLDSAQVYNTLYNSWSSLSLNPEHHYKIRFQLLHFAYISSDTTTVIQPVLNYTSSEQIFQIYSIKGKLISASESLNSIKNLPEGVYLLRNENQFQLIRNSED
jgi:hypothetical protein